jgi:hypothetical protein
MKDSKTFLKELKQYRENLRTPEFKECLYSAYKKRKPSKEMAVFLELSTAQSYGPRMEKFYIENKDCQKVPASLDCGDFSTKASKKGEYKFSYAKEENKYKFNFVQIRPWQKIDGYVFEIYSDKHGLEQFNISKEKMKDLLEEFGGYAHGTKKHNTNKMKEYALRGTIGGKLWNTLTISNSEAIWQ